MPASVTGNRKNMPSPCFRIGQFIAVALICLVVSRVGGESDTAGQLPHSAQLPAGDAVAEYQLALRDVRQPEGEGNPIDRLLLPYLKQHQVALDSIIGDERFARRVALDLLGLPLSPDQLRKFLADKRPRQARSARSAATR